MYSRAWPPLLCSEVEQSTSDLSPLQKAKITEVMITFKRQLSYSATSLKTKTSVQLHKGFFSKLAECCLFWAIPARRLGTSLKSWCKRTANTRISTLKIGKRDQESVGYVVMCKDSNKIQELTKRN